MRDFLNFSANVQTAFENNADNATEFNGLLLNAANRVYDKYSKEDTQTIIRNQFNKLLHVVDFKALSPMKRRQAYRAYGKDTYALVEDVLVDKMTSGWDSANARFMEYVKEVNLADGDKNEFYVEDNSLLQVSKFAGNHHDVNLIVLVA